MDQPPEGTRILVVDDEPGFLETIESLLAGHGYRTEAATSGPEALRRARHDPPDLVVLDVSMPDMDGFEVCRHLKADARTAAIPILFVTGLDTLRDKEEGLAAGADDYVTKPLDPPDLLARVRALLHVRHLSLELDRTLAYLQELEATRRSARSAQPDSRAGEVAGRASEAGRRGALDAMNVGPRDERAAHVLLVDDERFIRQVYGKILEGGGYRVTAVAGAAEAYEVAARGVDVVLLDIMMPEISGLEALERLRQVAPDVPIVILTAYQTAQNAIAALRGGAFDFIVKGLKNEVLVNGVARAVERRRLMLENRRLTEALRTRLDAAPAPPAPPAT